MTNTAKEEQIRRRQKLLTDDRSNAPRAPEEYTEEICRSVAEMSKCANDLPPGNDGQRRSGCTIISTDFEGNAGITCFTDGCKNRPGMSERKSSPTITRIHCETVQTLRRTSVAASRIRLPMPSLFDIPLSNLVRYSQSEHDRVFTFQRSIKAGPLRCFSLVERDRIGTMRERTWPRQW